MSTATQPENEVRDAAIASRLAAYDWTNIERDLDARGWAMLDALLSADAWQ